MLDVGDSQKKWEPFSEVFFIAGPGLYGIVPPWDSAQSVWQNTHTRKIQWIQYGEGFHFRQENFLSGHPIYGDIGHVRFCKKAQQYSNQKCEPVWQLPFASVCLMCLCLLC